MPTGGGGYCGARAIFPPAVSCQGISHSNLPVLESEDQSVTSCDSQKPQQLLSARRLPRPARYKAPSDAEMQPAMMPIKEARLSQFQRHKRDEKTNGVTECLLEQIYKPNHLPA